jgi:hypothetical protein
MLIVEISDPSFAPARRRQALSQTLFSDLALLYAALIERSSALAAIFLPFIGRVITPIRKKACPPWPAGPFAARALFFPPGHRALRKARQAIRTDHARQ